MILHTVIASLLFLQLVSLLTLGEICPHPEDISPCVCQYYDTTSNIDVHCIGGNVEDVAKAFLEFEDKTIRNVVLRNVKKGRLPSLLFWKVKVNQLTIASCQLDGIADSDGRPAFVGLENSLEKLNIVNSITGANKLVSVNLGHLSRLTRLDFTGNNIPEIGNEWFAKGPVNLSELIFESCSIRKLGDRAFEKLVNLSYLRIYDSDIRYFKRTMFPMPAKKLEILALRKVGLASSPTDLFDEMPVLERLFLNGNLIRRVQSSPFSSVWEKLGIIGLSDNPLECDDHMNWLYALKMPTEGVFGVCASPPKVKGQSLANFIDSNKKQQEVTRKLFSLIL